MDTFRKDRSGFKWHISHPFLQSFTNGWYNTGIQNEYRDGERIEGRIRRMHLLPFDVLYITVQTREIEHVQEGSFARNYEPVKPRSLFIPLHKYYVEKSGSCLVLEASKRPSRYWSFWPSSDIRPWDYEALTAGCMP